MSASWAFYSFDHDRFEQLFGSGSESHCEALIAVLTDDGYFDFDDPDIAVSVAQRVIAEGYSYDGATEEEYDVLDCIPSAIFNSSDVLSQSIDAKPESPEGLHINVVEELLRRASGNVDLALLPLFNGGRRYGGATSEYCEYVIFTPAEVAGLLAEARQVVGIDAGWSHPDFPPVIGKELLGPLQKIANANRGLAAFYP